MIVSNTVHVVSTTCTQSLLWILRKKNKRRERELQRNQKDEIIPVFRPPALGGGIPAFTNAWVTSEASFIMRYALNMFGLKNI